MRNETASSMALLPPFLTVSEGTSRRWRPDRRSAEVNFELPLLGRWALFAELAQGTGAKIVA
jgi:hypothetical protein